ncbi:MAG: HD domain-containing protein [Chryseolinea sp.]
MSPSQYSSTLLIKGEAFVKKLLSDKLPRVRTFHSIAHTADVAKASLRLGVEHELLKSDMELLLLAAWFHDTGYIYGNVEHEKNSVLVAEEFLSAWNCPQDYLPKIGALILSTKIPQNPQTVLQNILCDADLHHLGSDQYEMWSSLLKQEMEEDHHMNFSDKEWNKKNIHFFKEHDYFTQVARDLWGRQKEMNLASMVAVDNASNLS